jgi:hypothetical protein
MVYANGWKMAGCGREHKGGSLIPKVVVDPGRPVPVGSYGVVGALSRRYCSKANYIGPRMTSGIGLSAQNIEGWAC